jgi:hypothetical protein
MPNNEWSGIADVIQMGWPNVKQNDAPHKQGIVE